MIRFLLLFYSRRAIINKLLTKDEQTMTVNSLYYRAKGLKEKNEHMGTVCEKLANELFGSHDD